MPTVSVLHISDLHRSKDCEITNAALLASLLNDRDRYTTNESPSIQHPDIIIVSGDIIRGSVKMGDTEKELQEQYEEALDFLSDLAANFLDGDKNRIVIIPGNHDIDWRYSRESMVKIDNSLVFDDNNTVKQDILRAVLNQNSLTRWSWKDLSFYKINDIEIYNRRLAAFSNFYTAFYEGEKSYSLVPDEQFQIFDFPRYNVTIAAFNSCYNNDHMRLVGDIHPDCIAKANLQLRSFTKRGRLVLSTWHHNTKGLPYETHYMDSSRLKNFIDIGISLGFHGHQHKTEIIHEYSDVIEQKKIFVFSAGTLCGGPKELPAGNNRQYNLIEIHDVEEELDLRVTLHVREKTESSSFDNPIWTAGRIDSKNISYYTLRVPRPSISASGQLIEVEKLMVDGSYDIAKAMLLNLDVKDPFVRKFLVQCIIETNDYILAARLFASPETEEEAIMLLNATIQLGDRKLLEETTSYVKQKFSSIRSVGILIKKAEAIVK